MTEGAVLNMPDRVWRGRHSQQQDVELIIFFDLDDAFSKPAEAIVV